MLFLLVGQILVIQRADQVYIVGPLVRIVDMVDIEKRQHLAGRDRAGGAETELPAPGEVLVGLPIWECPPGNLRSLVDDIRRGPGKFFILSGLLQLVCMF
jgi:hypothetical protein